MKEGSRFTPEGEPHSPRAETAQHALSDLQDQSNPLEPSGTFQTIRLEPEEGIAIHIVPHGEVTISIYRPFNTDLSTQPDLRQQSPQSISSDPTEAPKAFTDIKSERSEKENRVNLAGRVGADPTLRQTPRGRTIARFPLAVREAGEDTPTWHQILAFDQRADKVKATVTKGQQVTVIGYPHQREVKHKDGSTRIVEEIYAVVVKPTKPDPARAGS